MRARSGSFISSTVVQSPIARAGSPGGSGSLLVVPHEPALCPGEQAHHYKHRRRQDPHRGGTGTAERAGAVRTGEREGGAAGRDGAVPAREGRGRVALGARPRRPYGPGDGPSRTENASCCELTRPDAPRDPPLNGPPLGTLTGARASARLRFRTIVGRERGPSGRPPRAPPRPWLGFFAASRPGFGDVRGVVRERRAIVRGGRVGRSGPAVRPRTPIRPDRGPPAGTGVIPLRPGHLGGRGRGRSRKLGPKTAGAPLFPQSAHIDSRLSCRNWRRIGGEFS